MNPERISFSITNSSNIKNFTFTSLGAILVHAKKGKACASRGIKAIKWAAEDKASRAADAELWRKISVFP